jgi:hypothetical protein
MRGKLLVFNNLRRKPVKKTRLMTHEEALAWVVSGEALGWIVNCDGYYSDSTNRAWRSPQFFEYEEDMRLYHRARISPDGTISDEHGFEVEE